MSATTLLQSIFHYKAAADQDLFAAVAALGAPGREEALRSVLRVLNHSHVVDRIFRAHLSGVAHGYAGTNTPETPTLAALREAVQETDQWYIDHTKHIDPAALEQTISFEFTDGKLGRMSREEILAHIATPAGYHRGAIGRIPDHESVPRPPDGLARYLHVAEPSRRAPE
jgi:uncharacterized damage-inducible protein DinB